MDGWRNPNEDERGVDVSQIRSQLRLPVKERVRVMVEAANLLIAVQKHARLLEHPGQTDVRPRSDLLDPERGAC